MEENIEEETIEEEEEMLARGLAKGMLNKGIELHNKINDHITRLTHDTVGLKGMSINKVTQRLINHLDNFDDLEYVKMLGGNEEYLTERKALIAEYPAILDLVSATVEKIMRSVPSDSEPMLNELRGHPYYHQLRQYVAIIELFIALIMPLPNNASD